MAREFKFDEAKLRPKQREVALALVEREFASKEERKTKTQIAEENEITMMTLWRWENNDGNFIMYKNHLASQFMDTRLPFVYRRMIDLIASGNGRMIEVFLKRMGELDTKTEISMTQNSDDKTQEERLAELRERLGEDDDEDDE